MVRRCVHAATARHVRPDGADIEMRESRDEVAKPEGAGAVGYTPRGLEHLLVHRQVTIHA